MTGCSSIFGLGEPGPAPPDATPPSCVIAGFDLCAHQQPNGPITFGSDTSIDTSLDCNVVLFDPAGGSLCIIYGTDIEVDSVITAHGPRPLVFAATGSITVSGSIDVNGHVNSLAGAGADPMECAAKTTQGVQSGGGAGGSFHGKGGDGGAGAVSPGTAGVAGEAVLPPTLARGGCPGQTNEQIAHGGGAVLLVANVAIHVTATAKVLANGAGGPNAQFFGFGGSGGGSGGLIRIVAPAVTISGIVAANGGGGGEGRDMTNPGMSGVDGTTTTQPAHGGGGTSAGGDGGNGGAGTTLAGLAGASTMTAMAGGGGGGGGAGFILISTPSLDVTGGTISPPSL